MKSVVKDARPEKNDWLVIVGASFSIVLLTGVGRTCGLIYSEIIDLYGVSRSEANIIFMTLRLCLFGFTPIASKLSTYYNYSTLLCAGGIFLFLSLFLSAFATAVWHLIISFGVMQGISFCLSLTPGILAISANFNKRRALALSIYFTIGGVGGLLMPFLFDMLLIKYKLSGAFLIFSALSLNTCPLAFLIHQAKTPQKKDLPETGALLSEKQVDICKDVEKQADLISPKQSSHNLKLIKQTLSYIRPDLSIFKNPQFLVMLGSRTLCAIPLLNLFLLAPDFVEGSFGDTISQSEIALLLSITSFGDIFGRIIIGLIIDKLPWHTKHTYGGASFTVGVIIFVYLLSNSYAMLLTLHVIYGFIFGAAIVMQYVLEVELMKTAEKTAQSHGISQAFMGLIVVISMSIIAYLRDVCGTYVIAFCLIGCAGLLGGLIWCLEPLIQKCLTPIEETEEPCSMKRSEIQEMCLSKLSIQ